MIKRKQRKKASHISIKNLLMPLFLMGCFPGGLQEVKRPLRTKSVKRPIKVGKRPINEGKRPIKAMVLVGISVGCLMGCFRAFPPWRKTAPLKRPIKRSMKVKSQVWNRESVDYTWKIEKEKSTDNAWLLIFPCSLFHCKSDLKVIEWESRLYFLFFGWSLALRLKVTKFGRL